MIAKLPVNDERLSATVERIGEDRGRLIIEYPPSSHGKHVWKAVRDIFNERRIAREIERQEVIR